MRLANRIAIVTGAAGGIGEAIAHMFAANGATIVAVDLNEAGVAATAGEIVAKKPHQADWTPGQVPHGLPRARTTAGM